MVREYYEMTFTVCHFLDLATFTIRFYILLNYKSKEVPFFLDKLLPFHCKKYIYNYIFSNDPRIALNITILSTVIIVCEFRSIDVHLCS